MKLSRALLYNSVSFVTITCCSVLQVSLLSRSLPANELGVALALYAWCTIAVELLDCRSWEVFASAAIRNAGSAHDEFRSLLKFEVLVSLGWLACGFILTGLVGSLWGTALWPVAVAVAVFSCGLMGLEGLLRSRAVRSGRWRSVLVARVVASIFALIATVSASAAGVIDVSAAVLLLTASRMVLVSLLWILAGAAPCDLADLGAANAGVQRSRPPARELIWTNLRGTGRSLVTKMDRLLLPLLWPAGDFAAYDLGRRVIDKLCGLGRPIADTLMDKHLAADAPPTGGRLKQQVGLLFLLSLGAAALVAALSHPICLALYGSALGAESAPFVVALCPIALLLAQAPCLPILVSHPRKHTVTVYMLVVAAGLAVALLMLGDRAKLVSAIAASCACVVVGVINIVVATSNPTGEQL